MCPLWNKRAEGAVLIALRFASNGARHGNIENRKRPKVTKVVDRYVEPWSGTRLQVSRF
jgi:hypothetical protein